MYAYTLCKKDVSLENNCDPLLSAGSATQAEINLFPLLPSATNRFIIQAVYKDGSQNKSNELALPLDQVNKHVTYIKLPKTERNDAFGTAMSISEDGRILAVGAPYINGKLYMDTGEVNIFKRVDAGWEPVRTLRPIETNHGVNFGISVSLSDDGKILAVGASDKNGTGKVHIYSDQPQNGWGFDITLSDTSYLTSQFGHSVSLSGDGTTVLIGSPSFLKTRGGAAIYKGKGTQWDIVDIFSAQSGDPQRKKNFGYSVALNKKGTMAIIGTPFDYRDLALSGSEGSADIYYLKDAAWTYKTTLWGKSRGDYFGWSVSINGVGDRIAIGAPDEGINSGGMGAVFIYDNTSSVMTLTGTLIGQAGNSPTQFGFDVDLSGDGKVLAVSEPSNNSALTGLMKPLSDMAASETAEKSGMVYLYQENQTAWKETLRIKPPKISDIGDLFGFDLALSTDGYSLAVGSPEEDSDAIGINQDQLNNNVEDTGAVFVY